MKFDFFNFRKVEAELSIFEVVLHQPHFVCLMQRGYLPVAPFTGLHAAAKSTEYSCEMTIGYQSSMPLVLSYLTMLPVTGLLN